MSPLSPPFPKKLKIAVIGYRAVGKTSICSRFAGGKRSEDSTIETYFKQLLTTKTREYKLLLVDTAAKDDFSISFLMQISMDVHGYVLVYSVDSLKSFKVATDIYKKMKNMPDKMHLHSILVGNKCDNFSSRQVFPAEGRELAKKWNGGFLEVSATNNLGVFEIFETLVNDMEKSEAKKKLKLSKYK